MNAFKDVIEVNPEILGGKPVFKGTRVSVSTLFDCLETTSLDDFLAGHPAVTREQAMTVLLLAEKLLESTSVLYEGVA